MSDIYDIQVLKQLPKIVVRYRVPNTKKAILQIVTSIIPYLTLRVSMYYLLQLGRRWSRISAIITAFFLVRIFIIQHDCGHQSFFSSHAANEWIGKICSILTFIPYTYRAAGHAFHHHHANKLWEFRDIGDLYTMTVEEFAHASRRKKFIYIVFRSPIVMFLIVPLRYILFNNRIPMARLPQKKILNKSLISNNLITLIVYGAIGYFFGAQTLLHVQLPILISFGTIAIWFFYIQHQHEFSYRARQDRWEYIRSAVQGSTFYDLPKWMHRLTGNIGYHHIHHLNESIPSYQLATCYAREPLLQQVAKKLTFTQSLSCAWNHLRDEQEQKMISFYAYYKKRFAPK